MGEVKSIDGGAQRQLTFPEKLLKLYEAFAYAQKGGENTALNFKFVQESQLKDRLNAKCRELGLFIHSLEFEVQSEHIIPRGKPEQGKFTHLVVCKCKLDLMDAAAVAVLPEEWLGGASSASSSTHSRSRSPQYAHLEGLGGGSDTSDKAPMKASVAAFKYALLNGLSVKTGNDPDAGGAREPDKDAYVLMGDIDACDTKEELIALKTYVAQHRTTEDWDAVKDAYNQRLKELNAAQSGTAEDKAPTGAGGK